MYGLNIVWYGHKVNHTGKEISSKSKGLMHFNLPTSVVITITLNLTAYLYF